MQVDPKQLEQLITNEFPLDGVIYLNHAGIAPWPKRTADAVKAFADENSYRGAQHYSQWIKTEQALKDKLSTLINAPSCDDIALLKSTSEALSIVAYGLEWQAGDEVVISNEEFPSNRIVWESLSRFGVKLIEANISNTLNPEQAVIDAISPNTKLLSISSTQFSSGLRLDLAPIGQYCRNNDVLFCVDAIQSIGAVQFDVQAINADFAMADGHKWMLGPEGLAMFYCREDIRKKLSLNQFGWHMVEAKGDYEQLDWQPAHSARRFECGSPNMLAAHALNASLSLLLDIGMDTVEQRLHSNVQYTLDALLDSGLVTITSQTQQQRRGGIISFNHRLQDNHSLWRKLLSQQIICVLRNGHIRFSPHFYTPIDAIDQAISALK